MPPGFWRRAAVAGVGALFFFDTLFELFHEIFFASGSFMFDPRTDKLVQLFPDDFWSDTTIALGVAIVVLGLAVRRGARSLAEPDAAPGISNSEAGA